jgi:hypothetical protein
MTPPSPTAAKEHGPTADPPIRDPKDLVADAGIVENPVIRSFLIRYHHWRLPLAG